MIKEVISRFFSILNNILKYLYEIFGIITYKYIKECAL
jgi:hypothetical protein